MPLFSGVPYITETPSEAIRKAPAGNANIIGSFARGMQIGAARQQQAALEPLRRLAAQAAQTRAYASQMNAQAGYQAAQIKLRQLQEQSSQLPALGEYQAALEAATNAGTLPLPPAGLTGPNQEYALGLLTQKRLALTAQESQRLRAEQIASVLKGREMIQQAKGDLNASELAEFSQRALAVRSTRDQFADPVDESERIDAAILQILNEIRSRRGTSVLPPAGQPIQLQTPSDFQDFLRSRENP